MSVPNPIRRPAALLRAAAAPACAAAAAGALACSAGRDAAPSVRFAELPSGAAPEGVRARAAGGRVVVEGTYTTGVCNLWVARGARLDGDTLTLWVRERGRRLWWAGLSACPDVARLTTFRATVGGLPAGTYRVRVDAGAGTWSGEGIAELVTVAARPPG
jgi:hypothetical protein